MHHHPARRTGTIVRLLAVAFILFLILPRSTAAQNDAPADVDIGEIVIDPAEGNPGDSLTITIPLTITAVDAESNATPDAALSGSWGIVNQLPDGVALDDVICNAAAEDTSCEIAPSGSTGLVIVSGTLQDGVDTVEFDIVISATVTDTASPDSELANVTCAVLQPSNSESPVAAGTPSTETVCEAGGDTTVETS
ncbi:MAG: hypothetical protein WKF81_14295, partial [Thermomicrobiales bacterium]